jgi:hypothetical protein
VRWAVNGRLAIVLAVGSLALAVAPAALADPIPIAPTEGQQFTARVGQLTFQAQSAVSPAPTRMDFYVSRDQNVDNQVLANPIDTFHAAPVGAPPAVYTANPGSDANWPNKPGTYFWQAVYHDCIVADLNCYGPIQSLTLDPLAPPTLSSPADGTTIGYGGQRIFSIADVPSYSHDGTHLNIEFSRSDDLASDGTFVDPLLVVPRPASAGADLYKYDFAKPFTNDPGTYYWIAERFDCAAESDCYVTNDEVRSFTVAPPVLGSPPNTRLTRHPGRRTHKRRVIFRFSSNPPGASFQCFYTGGWTPCQSPQKFRHLKPGRYRFKVRAVANGKRDPTPATFLFKVVHRHRRH